MDVLNNILHELGISKVKLAKYLGVSRQMVYNYLTFKSFNEWPNDKKVLLMQLLDLKELNNEVLTNIVIDTEYLMKVEEKLNLAIKSAYDIENYFDVSGLNRENKSALLDVTNVIKEILINDTTGKNIKSIKYLLYFLQTIDNIPEVNYFLAYMSKINGFIEPNEFAFNADKQFIFEAIIYSALSLYNGGGAKKDKIAEYRKRFVQEIEYKNEEKLSRTQQLFTTRDQALRELGYTKITAENFDEVLEKISEIDSRKAIFDEEK